ncbi:MAG: cell division protein ZapA [Lachnospiraceae bacterium]|nr:cell division protein ZapA [Lachnospiraceae bacterium]
MAGKNTAQVVIGGKVITLGGYESSDYLQKVANYMNGKLEEFSELPGYSRQPMEMKHMLLSLNISDDFFKAKKQAEILEQELSQKDQEMYDLKHELVSLKMKIEELEQEQEKLHKRLEK